MPNLKNPSTYEAALCGPPEQIPHLLEEMSRLLDSAMEPRDFFRAFLDRLVSATQALGGAFWHRANDGAFQLEHVLNWNTLGLETIVDGLSCHEHVLQVAAQRERALWVPPHSGRKIVGEDQQAANLTDRGLLLAPVLVDKQVVGLLEIWLESITDSSERQKLARFLTEMAGFLAAYQYKNQLQSLLQKQQLWTQLEAFSWQIHGSLEPATVALWIANEGRRLLACDQLSVAIRWGTTTELTAISGASTVERNSRLVQSLQTLGDCVLTWGDKLVYQGQRDDTLPLAVAQALDAYLAESNAKALIVLPLKDTRGNEEGESCGALIAESHDPTMSAERLRERLQMLANHAGPALANACHVDRMPLHKVSLALAAVRDSLAGRKLVRLGLYTIPLFLLVGVLTFVQIPLRLEAKGQLLPVQRQVVFAPLHGKVVELKARHGDRVDKGQELLLLEDLDSQLQIDQLAVKISSAEQRLAFLSEQIGKTTSNEERNVLTKDRINQEYEMRKAMAERDILLQGSRSPRKAPVLAPLAGKVVTFDMQEQLLGKRVKPGDSLLRVAAVKGAWEIELQIPERNLGPIRAGLHQNPQGYAEVDLLLTNQPHRTYKGRLYLDGLGGETAVKDAKVVLPARVRITDAELAAQLESMPVGLEVRTKVHCGKRPLGQVWFFEFWEFFYEHILF